MTLFEESGIPLLDGEILQKTGKCSWKIPKGLRKRTRTLGVFSKSDLRKQEIEWDTCEGEVVLTNIRVIFLTERGRRMSTHYEPVQTFELEVADCIEAGACGADSKEVELRLKVRGRQRLIYFYVDDAMSWMKAFSTIEMNRSD
ncbi:MAG: hypothetical protein V1915_03800 [Candidatus Bathyarchaeota archaeon]